MTDETRVGSRATGPAEPDTTGPAVADDEVPQPDGSVPDGSAPDGSAEEAAASTGRGRRWGRRRRSGAEAAAADGPADDSVDADDRAEDRVEDGADERADDEVGAGSSPSGRRRAVLPVVPVLGALLVLLLAGTAYLFLTRPGTSSVATDDYVDALQAARAGIVDVTSFDYLTLDDDITQIQAVTTGDLTQESVDRLNDSRQSLTDAQAVVNTEVVGAAVTAADDRTATVYMIIQSTQTSSASQQAQVQRYRIEVDLTQDGGRWLLSGIQGR